MEPEHEAIVPIRNRVQTSCGLGTTLQDETTQCDQEMGKLIVWFLRMEEQHHNQDSVQKSRRALQPKSADESSKKNSSDTISLPAPQRYARRQQSRSTPGGTCVQIG
jgi:hypothetical protein